MNKNKKVTSVMDTRNIKILSVKKEELKDSIVFVCQKSNNNNPDRTKLDKIIEEIDKIEPSGFYFVIDDDINVELHDKNEFKNKDLVITVNIENIDKEQLNKLKDDFVKAIPQAKSVTVINGSVGF